MHNHEEFHVLHLQLNAIMATAFSCDGSGVITRKVDLDYHSHGGAESYSDIESTFEIEKCVHWIDDGCYKMVCASHIS